MAKSIMSGLPWFWVLKTFWLHSPGALPVEFDPCPVHMMATWIYSWQLCRRWNWWVFRWCVWLEKEWHWASVHAWAWPVQVGWTLGPRDCWNNGNAVLESCTTDMNWLHVYRMYKAWRYAWELPNVWESVLVCARGCCSSWRSQLNGEYTWVISPAVISTPGADDAIESSEVDQKETWKLWGRRSTERMQSVNVEDYGKLWSSSGTSWVSIILYGKSSENMRILRIDALNMG